MKIQIGTDATMPSGSNAVMVECSNGTVRITGSCEGWLGYWELADLPIAEADAADAMARRIAANPIVELTALGYNLDGGWFRPL